MQNTAPENKNVKKKSKEFLQKFVKIENSPIIHNSISKLNLIQNVSNIYVTKSYLEEKPLTERKNKVLVSRINKDKKIYIKPKNISKKEYIRNNNHTENRNENENEEKIKNNVLQEKIRYNLDEKLHRSIRNIRSIKADNDDLNNYDVNSKESIIRKNYKQHMDFYSVMESKD